MKPAQASLPRVLIATLALFVSGSILASSVEPGTTQSDHSPPSASLQIRLQQASFDPLLTAPPLPPALTWEDIDRQRSHYYLVQFHGPIRSDWRKRLEQAGAEVLDYVPDFAYLVRLHPERVEAVRRLDVTRWVGLYEPAFRLSNDLIADLPTARADRLVALVVRTFPGQVQAQLASQLLAEGVEITEQHPDRGDGAIFRLNAAQTTVADLSHIPDVAWIEPEREPAFLNEVARSNLIMAQDQVETDLGIYGANQIVAVGDTGLSTGNAGTVHSDFSGRVVGGTWGPGSCGTWADNHSHGTHVAGSVLGSGFRSGADIPNQDYSGSNAGIAPEAGLYVWSFCNNFSGLPGAPYGDYYGVLRAVDPDLRISTNSWGYTSGFGQYNIFTRETDRFVRDHPDMVILYSAGNNGTDADSNGVVDPGSIGMPGTGKNVITVGASENVRAGNSFTWGAAWPSDFPANPINGDTVANNENGMAAFSSRGPTLSGRLKPDIVGPGTNIVSTRNESTGTGWGVYDTYYLYMGGTSMSTPLVAGGSAIVREYFQSVHGVANPGAALVKGLLINGAVDMTPGQYGAGATQDVIRRPDNNQGWGRVDLADSMIYTGNRSLWFEEHAGLGTGQIYQVSVDAIASATPLRFTLVWADHQGTEASHGALVNDLDLIVEDPSSAIHRGNEIITGGGADRTNNVEGIDLAPMAGTYTITVEGFNVPQGPQPFALLISGDLQSGPVGDLNGTVDDGTDPLENATVTVVGPVTQSVQTDASGAYSVTLPAGSYDVTASMSMHNPETVTGVAVTDGGTTTRDFSLTAIPSAVLTVCSTPNLAIPDGDPAGIDDALSVAVSESILDVNVQLIGTHTWVGDLIFELTHPDGVTSAVIVDRPGVPASTWGCDGDNFDLWLDDEGTDGQVENQCAGTPPALFGQATPNQALSAFDGLLADGDWTLTISDNATPDPGTLEEWCLEITHEMTTPGPHTVTASVGSGNGSITPPSQSVDHGDDAAFTVTADPGWSVDSVSGDTCSPADAGGGSWTATNITADCAVTASFVIDSYTVTASVGSGNGSITPPSQSVDHGDDAAFTVTPDPGWSVDSVSGDTCSPADAGGGSWTATNITADCAVTASFVIDSYTVTASVGSGNGSITPPSQSVDHGDSANFTVTADPGWSVDSVSGDTCSPADAGGGSWTATNITADCAVTASFVIDSYTVTASVGSGNGTITPPSQSVDHGDDAAFTVTPDPGWSVDSVSGDTCSPADAGGASWTATNITADCAVTASFVIDSYTVTASVGSGNGSITPPSQSVDHGDDAAFTVTPDPGWSVDSVSGDTCSPADAGGGSWTAANITADCAVTASFVIDSYTVTPSAGPGGSISPATPQTVDHDQTQQFTLIPDPGHAIDTVGGSCGGSLSGDVYTTDPVTEDCTVEADFKVLVDAVFDDRFEVSPP